MERKRLVVIGGGIGGYAAALRAAKSGAEVTLIERREIGGVCLNRGCIPSKVYLQAADLLHTSRKAATFGLLGELQPDFPAIKARKGKVVKTLTSGVNALLRAAKVRVVAGSATFVDSKTVTVAETSERITGDIFVIATGSVPVQLPIKGADGAPLLSSDDLLDLDKPPASLIIVGGGYIGVELGQFYSRLGTKVTIVEMTPRIVPTEDAAVADALRKALESEGMTIITDAAIEEVGKQGDQFTATAKTAEGKRTFTADVIAATAGRRPDFTGLDVERIGVALTDKKAIKVDARMQTSIPHIYAIGDCIGNVMLAHVAAAEAEVAVANALGEGREMSYRAVPRCIYTDPEVACVGMTEEQARAEYADVKVANFPFRAVGKALVADSINGMVKIVADGKHNEILGVHIIGAHATEMISEAVLAIGLECTAEEVARSIHPHPTLCEGVGEAAMMLAGGALHLP